MKLKAYCIACQVAVVACEQNRTHTVTVVCVTKTGPVLVFREGVKKPSCMENPFIFCRHLPFSSFSMAGGSIVMAQTDVSLYVQ